MNGSPSLPPSLLPSLPPSFLPYLQAVIFSFSSQSLPFENVPYPPTPSLPPSLHVSLSTYPEELHFLQIVAKFLEAALD